jgi:hypothetical protein
MPPVEMAQVMVVRIGIPPGAVHRISLVPEQQVQQVVNHAVRQDLMLGETGQDMVWTIARR